MKIKVIQTRVGYYEPLLTDYPENITPLGIIDIDYDNAHEDPGFMDYCDATDEYIFEVIEN